MAIVADRSNNNTIIDRHYNRAAQPVFNITTTAVDRSFTATTTSQQIMAANSSRQSAFIKNDSAVVVWIKFGTTAATAVAGSGNIQIPVGGYFEFTDQRAVQIIAASATAAVTAEER